MRNLAVGLLTLMAIAGCCRHSVYSPSPGDELAYAEEQVLAQRLVKQRLIRADPIERKIEAQLRQDPRVASARFAIIIYTFGGHSDWLDASLPFTVIVSTHEPMSEADASAVLDAALKDAGYRLSAMSSGPVVEGNQWGVRWGTLIPLDVDNPVLRVEGE